eukprot:SAG11_NODE_11226_length_775_cov_1.072485_2_plen_64_part_01
MHFGSDESMRMLANSVIEPGTSTTSPSAQPMANSLLICHDAPKSWLNHMCIASGSQSRFAQERQ